MACLPVANILHYKLRSVLNVLGIGIGICMLITLSGLARGSLYEIAHRWESVDADLLVFPRGWGNEVTARSGTGLSDRYKGLILSEHGKMVRRVAPVFTWPLRLGGQDQVAAGVDTAYLDMLLGGRELLQGRPCDPDGRFAEWIERKLTTPTDSDTPLTLSQDELSRPGRDGLELVIDARLARAGGYEPGQTVRAVGHEWTIVGIAPAGVMTRVFMPRRTAQYLFGDGDLGRSTLLLVQLEPGVDVGPAARQLRKTTGQDAVPLAAYRGMLEEKFGIMFTYVDAVNVIALIIAFLFVMVTLYTMVLQRTREIAVLKSFGASDAFLVGQVLAEALLLTGAGTVVGVGMSFLAAGAIQFARPLLTVTITPYWVLAAVGAATAGAVLSGLYPAWRATRVDMVAALTLE